MGKVKQTKAAVPYKVGAIAACATLQENQPESPCMDLCESLGLEIPWDGRIDAIASEHKQIS
jgi:hypothetical protein